MQFVLQFLQLKEISADLRIKIKRYLDYNFELKKDLEIEESELMDLLNDDMRNTITIYINGKILKSVDVLS